jgi:hypothetical protein
MLRRRGSFSHRELRPLNRLCFALGLVIFLVGPPVAHATTVVMLWPPSPSADITQALTLLRGELLSVGLAVTVSDRKSTAEGAGPNSVAWLEPFAAEGASAVIDTMGDAVLEAVDVWIVKTNPRRFEVTHVTLEPEVPRRAEILALRALEALRAGLLQIDWAERKRRSDAVESTPIAQPPTPAPRAVAIDRVGVEIGAVATMSLDGLGPAVLPTLRGTWAARPWLLLQASLAGLGSRSTVSTTAGSAQVAQQYALLGGCYRLRPNRRVWPFAGIAAGALRTSIEGQTGPATGGHTGERWSALLDLALGTGFRLGDRWYLTLAAGAQLARPYVAIHIVDEVAATSGRPNLLSTLTIGAWL